MKKWYFIFGLIFGMWNVQSQTLTLEDCYQKTQKNYPLIRQLDLINQSEKYNVQNVSRAWIPQISLSAKATYQTEVLELPFEIPGLTTPKIPKDQYSATLQLNQMIWDGGKISALRQQIKAGSEIQRIQYEVDNYALRERINGLFFGIILLNGQIEQCQVNMQEIKRNYEDAQTYYQNGMANLSDLDAVKVAQYSLEQNMIQLNALKNSYLAMLSLFIGETLNRNTVFIKPPVEEVSRIENKRPELQLIEANIAMQNIQKKFITAKNMPQIGLFVQGAYARPGLNMFSDKFSPYAIGGVQLLWNFGNLYTLNNDKRLIDNQIQNGLIQKDIFTLNTKIQSEQQRAAIEQYKQLLQTDDEIIRLRENVRQVSEIKVKNGTLSTTDLMRDLNEELSARVLKVIHEIQYLKSLYDLKNTNNQ